MSTEKNKPSLLGGPTKQSAALIPKLRFKDFGGSWEKNKLGNVAKITSGGTPSRSNANFWNGTIPWITTSLIKFNEILDAEEFITEEAVSGSSAKLFSKGTILMAMYGQGKTRGTVAFLGIDATTNQACAAIIASENIDKKYLFQNLAGRYDEIRELSNDGGQQNLSGGLIKGIPFSFPLLPEQQKIASFLAAVDEKVQQLSKKKELLEQYKIGVMQQLFSYEKRLLKGELRKGKLGDFGFFYYGKGAPKTSIVEGAPTPCVRYGELYSTFKEEIKEIKSYTIVDAKDLKLSKGGEVLVPRVGEKPLEFANCSYLPFANVAIGEMISVYNTDEDGLFMAYYINARLQKQLARMVEGGNVSNLYFRYVAEIEVEIPCVEEQHKIIGFVSRIDTKIESVNNQITQTQTFKKGLLQQMFV